MEDGGGNKSGVVRHGEWTDKKKRDNVNKSAWGGGRGIFTNEVGDKLGRCLGGESHGAVGGKGRTGGGGVGPIGGNNVKRDGNEMTLLREGSEEGRRKKEEGRRKKEAGGGRGREGSSSWIESAGNEEKRQ